MSAGAEIEVKSITRDRVLTAEAIAQGMGLYRDVGVGAHESMEIETWLLEGSGF